MPEQAARASLGSTAPPSEAPLTDDSDSDDQVTIIVRNTTCCFSIDNGLQESKLKAAFSAEKLQLSRYALSVL